MTAVCVSSQVIKEIKKIIKQSEIIKEDDGKCPRRTRTDARSWKFASMESTSRFETAKIGSLVDVTESADPEGLRVFYYLVQDLKALVFSLIALHFKVGMAVAA